jgi:hypothetical protein
MERRRDVRDILVTRLWLLEFRWQGVTIYLASSPTIRGTDTNDIVPGLRIHYLT